MSSPANIIIDVDVGSDDAWAILILLLAEKMGFLRILGILASTGNTHQNHVLANTARILNLLEISNIPVYKGVDEPLFDQINFEHDHFHGLDGMGDLEYDWHPDYSMLVNTSGIVAVRDLIAARPPKDVTLICLGPLTNAALLLKTFKDIELKELVIMGGNYKGLGNITPAAEFNFYFDPEAARIVFETATSPILLLPWETCVLSKTSLSWRFDIKPKTENKVFEMLTAAERKIYADALDGDMWLVCDAQLAAVFAFRDRLKPTLEDAKLWVETEGVYTRGQAVVTTTEAPNVNIVTSFSDDGFKQVILDVVNGVNVKTIKV